MRFLWRKWVPTMRKLDFQGWKKIYGFTLRQQWKSKTARIMTVVFLLVALFAPVLMDLFSDEHETVGSCPAETISVAVQNGETEDGAMQTSLAQWMEETDYFKETDIVSAEEKPQAAVAVTVQPGSYEIGVTFDPECDLSRGEAQELADYLEQNWKRYLVSANGLSPDTLGAVSQPVTVNVEALEDSQNEAISQAEYWTSYTLIMALILILSIGGEAISASVVMEKSSKVVELLMTSVKPMAIVLGKVLAMITYLLIQFALVIAGFFVGSTVYDSVKAGSFQGIRLPEALHSLIDGGLPGIAQNWLVVPAVIVLCLLGILLFSIVAALAGATVSRIEELAEGSKIYVILLMICAYAGLMLSITAMDGISSALIYGASLFPFTSVFVAPAYAFSGKISIWIVLLAILLLIAAIWLALRFVAGVYGYLLYYKGSPVKFKQLWKISGFGKRKGGDLHE